MNESQVLCVFFGSIAVLLGVALIFVRVDRSELSTKVHTNPGLALFRFPAWRWGMALVFIVGGLLLVIAGIGWLGT